MRVYRNPVIPRNKHYMTVGRKQEENNKCNNKQAIAKHLSAVRALSFAL